MLAAGKRGISEAALENSAWRKWRQKRIMIEASKRIEIEMKERKRGENNGGVSKAAKMAA